MARPRIDIKQDDFEELCKLQCTLNEIAGFFHCSKDTIERFCEREYGQCFADTYKVYADQGKISLRRYMWKHAEKSYAMCMFLAKNLLGYKESGFEGDSVEDTCKQMASALITACKKEVANDTTDTKAEICN